MASLASVTARWVVSVRLLIKSNQGCRRPRCSSARVGRVNQCESNAVAGFCDEYCNTATVGGWVGDVVGGRWRRFRCRNARVGRHARRMGA